MGSKKALNALPKYRSALMPKAKDGPQGGAGFKREDAIQNSGYHFSEMSWQLESIRATVFAPEVKALGLSDWQALTGKRPAQTQENQEIDGIVEAGPYRGNWLTMGLARRPGRGPGRADLILAPPQRTVLVPLPDPRQERIESAAIGPFTTNFSQFMELARRWLSTDTNVKRLALACTLWERTSTPEDALDIILSRYVRSFKMESNDRVIDFLIQLNRPRLSRVDPSISINRFAQWSARQVEIVLPSRIMFKPVTIQYHRAQADLDISTADDADIGGQQIRDHLEELAELVLEIAEKGDVP